MATASKLIELDNYVNGEFTASRDGATLEIVNLSTGEPYATSPLSGHPPTSTVRPVGGRRR
jgi:hypothetical protein